jgi:mersacidin/lichenicidin family type 2 lantibiotic
MSINVIRAWKDPEYRLGLSEAERAMVQAHPAGVIEHGFHGKRPNGGYTNFYSKCDLPHTPRPISSTILGL